MKIIRFTGIISILLFLFFHADTVLAADTTWQNDYTYELKGNYIQLKKYNGSASSLTNIWKESPPSKR